jgi:hypothetical protein
MYLLFINAICGSSEFKTEDELSYHVKTMH